MNANTNETKRHYIADEELGGIPREYVETDRKAVVGDYVVGSGKFIRKVYGLVKSGVIKVETLGGDDRGTYTSDFYKTLSPTDIIRHNGERYRLVVRKAEAGEIILIKANEEIWMRDMTVGKMYEVVLDYPGNYVEVMDDVNDSAQAVVGNYYVIEPVIDVGSEKLEGDQSIQQQYREYAERKAIAESQPDLVDLVIRLTRTVAELEKRVGKEDSLALKAHHKAYNNRLDVEELYDKVAELEKTADNADYKAGQALTTAELQAEKLREYLESPTPYVEQSELIETNGVIRRIKERVNLLADERTQDCMCRRCCR